ncbi:MAG: hypothetical protein KF749_08415 [Bacteroidetes bacterium]|nr:hypothetical protein [Bacteroidota bacterium]MCW5895972.1 hypothetical protein [Bacteroidota bacterium]
MKNNALGLYLSETTAQAIIIERLGNRSVLAAAREWENTLFDYAGDDTPGMDAFVDLLDQFLNSTPVRVQRSGVALDTSLLFFNTIPFEATATHEQMLQHIRWELGEYFPGLPRNAFISDTHTLARHNGSQFDNILAVSVRRDLIGKLRHGLGKLQLRLDVVDSDHFSADGLLRMNYPEAVNKSHALLGLKGERLDASILRSSEVESFAYFSLHSSRAVLERIGWLNRISPTLNTIYVYGTEVTRELLAEIRNSSPIPVEELDPFRHIEVAEGVRQESNPEFTPARYVASIGIALRPE